MPSFDLFGESGVNKRGKQLSSPCQIFQLFDETDLSHFLYSRLRSAINLELFVWVALFTQ